MQQLLSTELHIDYPSKPGAIRNVRFDIAPGEIVGLVGQSGSGKSTLALGILRLLDSRRARVRGTIQFQGRDLMQCSERELRQVRGREIGLVLQNASASLNPNLRIRTQFKEAWRAHSTGDWTTQEQKVVQLLERLDLCVDEHFLRRYPAQISVGQAQRVLLAMAMMHHPRLLILDEPTSALDPIARVELLELFRGLNRDFGTALLYISHDLSSVASLCHRVSILRDGTIIETGTPKEIFTNPRQSFTEALVNASQVHAFYEKTFVPSCK